MTYEEAINQAKSLEETKRISKQFFVDISKNLDWSEKELSNCLNHSSSVESEIRDEFLDNQIMWHKNYRDFYLGILNLEYKYR